MIKVLFKDAGYNIAPLGIEELIKEVQMIPPLVYRTLNLSQTLRSLPDFFVSLPNFEKSYLVEVKYRARWNETTKANLKNALEGQVQQWQPVYLVLFLGERARTTDTPASYLGVVRLEHNNGTLGFIEMDTETESFRPWSDLQWDNFKRLHDVFTEVHTRYEDSTITKAVALVKSMKSILIDKAN
ncbi:hypothetical protein D3C72_1459070 [compost metagenome]